MIAKLGKPEDPENVPADWYEGRMRVRRNLLLTASDFSQLEDAPVDKNAWAAYRQQLRDFPATWTPGPIADFPDPPA